MLTLRPISPENTVIFRAVRLRALEDSPLAFGSTYARESQLTDQDWQERSVRWITPGSIGYLAFKDEDACAMVACYTEQEKPWRGHIVSMWVDPAHRRLGVGRLLIKSLIGWSMALGLRELKLMVTGVNDAAIRFYESLSFEKTGLTEPYPNDPELLEYEMILRLGA